MQELKEETERITEKSEDDKELNKNQSKAEHEELLRPKKKCEQYRKLATGSESIQISHKESI